MHRQRQSLTKVAPKTCVFQCSECHQVHAAHHFRPRFRKCQRRKSENKSQGNQRIQIPSGLASKFESIFEDSMHGSHVRAATAFHRKIMTTHSPSLTKHTFPSSNEGCPGVGMTPSPCRKGSYCARSGASIASAHSHQVREAARRTRSLNTPATTTPSPFSTNRQMVAPIFDRVGH